MKKLLLSAFLFLPLMASAWESTIHYNTKVDGIYYLFDNSKMTATVTYAGYYYISRLDEEDGKNAKIVSDYSGSVEIPSEVFYNNRTYTVSSIGFKAFLGCSSLTSVTIPDCVISIREYAFSGCSGLTSMTIPGNVTTIGNEAFNGCSSLTSITIPDNVTTIGKSAYKGCSGLRTFVIGKGVTSIGETAFGGCNLADVYCSSGVFPAANNSFGEYKIVESKWGKEEVFYRNTQNTTLHVPGLLIGLYQNNYPWSGFGKIVPLPDDEVDMEVGNFTKIINFADSKVKASLMNVCDFNGDNEISEGEAERVNDALFSKINFDTEIVSFNEFSYFTALGTVGENKFKNYASLTSITIPEGVTSIKDFAFYGCSSLTSVSFPNSLKSIGKQSFSYCKDLSLTVPKEVTSIGLDAFGECKCVTILSDETLAGCSFSNAGPISVIIGDEVTCIGEDTFHFTYVKNVIIGKGMKSIAPEAFMQSRGLNTVVIGSGNIGENAFWKCENLTTFTIDSGSIGNFAFDECSNLTSVTIGSGVESIGEFAFHECKNMTSVIIESGNIGEGAFSECNSLTSVTIGDGVESIGNYAFHECHSLTSLTIGSGVKSIGEYAFIGCFDRDNPQVYEEGGYVGLTSVYFYAIEAPSGIETAFETLATKEITLYVPVGCLESYKAVDEKMNEFEKFKDIKEFYKEEATTYTVEDSNTLTVKEVAETTEEAVDIPASVTIDGETYPVTAIAENAFEGNTVIKKVTIPESIEEIGDNAFADCTELSTICCLSEEPITLGSTVVSTRTRGAVEETTINVFNGVDKVTCLLYVPAGSVNKYKVTDGWKDFKYIVGIGTTFIIGNVNGDNVLDENDLNAIINHIMGMPQEGSFDVNMADVNKDDDVNAADVVFLAKMLSKRE